MDKIHARNNRHGHLISCWLVRYDAPTLTGTKPTDEVFDNLQEAREFEAWCKKAGKTYTLAQSTDQPRWIKQRALRPVPPVRD